MERIYTIPLRRGTMTAPRTRRAKKAIFVLKEFIYKHMKCTECKLSEQLNELIWSQGMRNPILKVKVIVTKDDKGLVRVRLFGEDAPNTKKDAKKAPATKKATTPAKKAESKPAVVDTKATEVSESADVEQPVAKTETEAKPAKAEGKPEAKKAE